RFRWATFNGLADFTGATFKHDTRFGSATFKGWADFHRATFNSGAGFDEATFQGDISFRKATFQGGDARFTGARFEGDMPMLGPIAVRGRLDLNEVQFASSVRIEIDASVFTCRRGKFSGGVLFDVRRAVVRLDDSDLSIPSLL